MLLHEWPLVLFTLLSQTAAGIVLTGECMLCRAERPGARRRILGQSVAALVLLCLAGFFSLAHTGSPLNAVNTIRNIDSSWLSREIALAGVFGLSLLWLAAGRIRKEPRPGEKTAALIAIAAGLALVAATSMVYSTPMVPAWSSSLSLPAFFGSTLVLGSAWNAFFLRRDIAAPRSGVSGPNPAGDGAPLLFFALAGLVLIAVSLPHSIPCQEAAVNINTMPAPAAFLGELAIWHAALSGIGVLLVGAAILNWPPVPAALPISGLAFLLLLSGEFVGRAAFYLSYARLGM